MSQLDEDDLARSYELQRRMARDEEREQDHLLVRRRRPRYFARVMFHPVVAATEPRKAS